MKRGEAAQHRGNAYKWISTGITGLLIIVRLIFECHRRYLAAGMYLGGVRFEKAQQSKELKAIEAGKIGPGLRDYRITVECTGKLEHKFLERLRVLMSDAQLYEAIPFEQRTEALRARCFTMTSYAAAAAVEHEAECTTFPNKLFTCIHEPGAFKEFDDVKECQKDLWSLEVLAFYREGDREDFRHDMRMGAKMIRTDTAPRECSHSVVRRLLHMLSVQTHVLAIDRLNAHFMARTAVSFSSWLPRLPRLRRNVRRPRTRMEVWRESPSRPRRKLELARETARGELGCLRR